MCDLKEVVDLCQWDCGIQICCNTVSCDGYPASNLLSSKANSKGFLAEYYIRPPVVLSLHLPFPVIVHQLSWDTRVNNQTSVFHTVLGSKETGRCSATCSLYSESDQPAVVPQHLGRGMAVNGRISFVNPIAAGGGSSSSVNQDYRLSCREDRALLNRLRLIQIQILRTDAAAVPGLRCLRLLCQPADKAGAAALAAVKAKHQQLRDEGSRRLGFFGGDQSLCVEEVAVVAFPRVEAEEREDVQLPPEFLDEITQELMMIPMVLPSGHLVDRTTLEKCNSAQAAYGGPPRDPFTGAPYRDRLAPMFNAALKSRIDRFLADHPGFVPSSRGNTLGDAASIQRFLDSGPARSADRRRIECAALHRTARELQTEELSESKSSAIGQDQPARKKAKKDLLIA